ncbi:gp53-like domain-containing protein [Rhizobium sp. HT1-10]|uniref:gp53-like domain-containing protein n=1 Tax=Rhizobium sp. HT1-10 TaxID=3111638 RepID=UPI003C26D444
MQISNLPATKLAIPFASSAGGGYIRTIPQASQIGITNGAASLTDGFPPLNFLPVGSGGVPPFGQDMNGILNEITAWTRWQNAGGLVPYDSAFSTAISGYPQSALLAGTAAGSLFLSTADNNTTNPNSGGANWIGVATAPTVQTGQYTYAVAGGTANALTATLTPAPASLTTGMVIRLLLTNTNTGGATLNVNGLGAVGIVRNDLTGLLNNDLVTGTAVELIFNGSFWQLVGLLNTTKPFYQGVASAGGTLTVAQIGSVVQFGVGAGAFTVNLPLSSTCPNGGRINFFHNGNNPVTLQIQGVDQIGYADGTLSSSIVVNTGDTLELLCLGLSATWLVIDGSMGNRAASDFKKVLTASNGYQKLPNGMIMQWGTGTGSASGAVNVTLPTTFPGTARSLVISVQGSTATSVCANYTALTTSGFTATTTFGGSFAALTFSYIVLGT